MNARDSESLSEVLLRVGHQSASEAEARLLIVNTCSVREKAEDKAIGKLGLMAAGKRKEPGLIVGAVGCMAQRMGETLLKRVPGMDFVVGTHKLHTLPSVLEYVAGGHGSIVETGEPDDEPTVLTGHSDGGVSAFVNVLLGCDRRCAYCIVPSVRGREWSRSGADVVAEVRHLASQGIREVTLLGQSVLSYGRKNSVWEATAGYSGPDEPFARLLYEVAAVEGIRRVRFTSGHPVGVTDQLVDVINTTSEVCAHLHLPLQSGSDPVLQRMRRGYSSADYRRAVDKLRGTNADFGLSTDIIVGFCGETGADFESTRTLMNHVQFDNAFIFKYSPRSGTPAAEWVDDVSFELKAERNAILLAEQDGNGLLRNRRLVGRQLSVMGEGASRRRPDRWSGRTEANTIAVFEPVEGVSAGDMLSVRIDAVKPQTLYGTLVC